ncbi:MAG: cytochrome B6 [Gammaproteobacteria bacterium]|nr:cytochrome B6 [Gammaproteobacteria bacterium]
MAAAAMFAAGLAYANGGEPIRPIPATPDVDPARAALGERLFHDAQLSKDGTVSCATCHDLASGGDDGGRVSFGVGGAAGPINAPTVFNVGFNFKQFWDGRADTLEAQVDGPVQSPVEMGSLWPDIVAKLYRDENYPSEFAAIYPDGITRDTIKNALAEFMRSLTTPGSRFDAWLAGDENAITALERRGYELFKFYGCVSCHQGANVGGNMFQVFGVINNYFTRRGDITDADRGRFNVTGNEADMHAFKVPSLRMAVHTAPYLHDGRAATLRDAVDIMFEFQLGREAPDADKNAIVAFIRTLAGQRARLDQIPTGSSEATAQAEFQTSQGAHGDPDERTGRP